MGESGSGKSVTGLALTRLLPEPPTIYESGRDPARWARNVLKMTAARIARRCAAHKIAYIFQEPEHLAEPGLHHPQPDRRGDPAAPPRSEATSTRKSSSISTMVGIVDPAQADARLPAPAQRRHAAARDDRHGASLPARSPRRRRADHRARCHHPGADHRPAARAEAAARHGDHPDHPQLRHHRRYRRSRGRDVPRARSWNTARRARCSPTRSTLTPRR